MTEQKQKITLADYLFICPDCNKKVPTDLFKKHNRECMEYKYQNWKTVYPEKAKEWEEKLKTINTKKDQHKTIQQIVSEVFNF